MLTIQDIKNAQKQIQKYIYTTPVIHLENIDSIFGAEIYIKAECMQKTNSFKIRGALNAMLSLDKTVLEKGVVTASSGNHGKGLAFAASLLNVPATVVLPNTAPTIKVEGIRNLGANTVMCEPSERYAVAEQIATESGATYIHPFDDPMVIAGQGTIGLEIMDQLPNVDKIIIPRNAHRSTIGGIILSGAMPVFVQPEINEKYGIATGVSEESLKKAIKENKYDVEYCKTLLKRHERVVEITKDSPYPVKAI